MKKPEYIKFRRLKNKVIQDKTKLAKQDILEVCPTSIAMFVPIVFHDLYFLPSTPFSYFANEYSVVCYLFTII